MRTLLLRRVGAHPAALVAVATSVLTSMLVVATLQLLSVGIADAGVRAELGVPASQRGVTLTAGLRPGELAEADRRVRAAVDAGGDATLTRTAAATTRGLVGGAPTDRVLLADLDGLTGRARLVSGDWPAAPPAGTAPGGDPVQAVVPENVATALSLAVGDRLGLTDLITRDAPPLAVVVSGVYAPVGVDDGLWADDPLGLRGVVRTDFTTYGPVVLAAGAFDGPLVGASTVTWRWTPDVRAMDGTRLTGLATRLDDVVDRLERVAGVGTTASSDAGAEQPLRDARVTTSLPAVVRQATVSEARVRAALLAPTVLLVVLGTSSLVVAAALLAALRDVETRLLRTRGASTGRLATLALADALAVVAVGTVGSLLVAPVLARAVARGAGLGADDLATGSSVGALPWVSVVVMGLLATVVVVTTTLRVGRARGGARGGSRGAAKVLRALGSSGLDVALVGLSVLGVVQLRRYDTAGSVVADPLTIAAPALVVAGSAVLCLRLLPLLSSQVARVTSARPSLDVAWGGWQLSRRLASQSGTVLLVLLAVSMGSLALSHSATAQQAVEDQSSFETGGPVRVLTGAVGGARLAALGATLDGVAGGSDRLTPVVRDVVDVGPVTGVTVLAVDAAVVGRVATPRADGLDGRDWAALTRGLAARRGPVPGVALPEGARSLSVRLRLEAPKDTDPGFAVETTVLVREATGLVETLPLGPVGPRSGDLVIDLPPARGGPSTVLGVVATTTAQLGQSLGPVGAFDPATTPIAGSGLFSLVVESASADGRALAGVDAMRDRPNPDALVTAVDAAPTDVVPAVVTRALAEATGAKQGSRLEVLLAGRRVPLEVADVIETVPTATTPDRAVLVDLPTVSVLGEPPASDRRLSSRPLEPSEWWLAPRAAVDAEALLGELPGGSTLALRSDVVGDRLDNPVNAGMRAAMLLVTAAALVLAAVGFAATTAALGRERRRENAVLLALGMPPGRIRRTLEAERVAVVVLTVVVGLVLGVLSALAVVPVLVGGDGHRQVPSVLVALPWARLVLFAALVALVLAVVGVLVLRRVGTDVAAELRRGES
ncbi:FtsX-like permease family protein [Oryzobacter telluris]|uniref:FtsX-like permease family protein n=1 Tax=Oryzobacter telluris TaxID=3149179 RepID=UPI00370DA27F